MLQDQDGPYAEGENETEDEEDDSPNAEPVNLQKLLADYALDPAACFYGPDGDLEAAAGRGAGLRFAGTYFPKAEDNLYIGTSYFTVSGFDTARHFIENGPSVHILVGQKQGQSATKATVNEMATVLKPILKELGTTPHPLANAVRMLLDLIDKGKFTFHSVGEVPADTTGEWRRFHCKIYIIDDVVVWPGSANFTRNGLVRYGNDEQLMASWDAAKIKYFTDYFKATVAVADDLLEKLEELLKKWLGMHKPFEAYLKALLCTYGEKRYLTEDPANEPTDYQEGAIVYAVDQLQQHNGCLLLIATGLGKTVIGSEVARRVLSESSSAHVPRLIVIAPRTTEESWRNEIKGRGCCGMDFFDNSALFKSPSDEDNSQANLLEECIERCTPRTLFIIDEAHRYRNLKLSEARTHRKNKKLPPVLQECNRVIDRVNKIAEKGGKVLLLTATPYGTQKQNINSLLRMLPPYLPTEEVIGSDLFDPNIGLPSKTHWCVSHVKKTASLKVVFVLSMLHVLQMARDNYNIDVPSGRLFLVMPGKGRRYFPRKITLHRVNYPLYLWGLMERAQIAKAFDGRICYDRWSDDKDSLEAGATNAWLNNTHRAWLSSPSEFRRVLEICRDTPDPALHSSDTSTQLPLDSEEIEEGPEFEEESSEMVKHCRVAFALAQAERRKYVQPLLNALRSAEDTKLARLELIIASHPIPEKIIIFVRRRSTALYLQSKLESTGRKIGCTVERSHNGTVYKLKSPKLRHQIIRNFAPKANPARDGSMPTEAELLNILICTDADGIGQNMQDATIVVNYDLPLTADELFQRVGRVLRPTAESDRDVSLYTFVPEVDGAYLHAAKSIGGIIQKLFDRQNKANDVIDSGRILPDENGPCTVEIKLACATDLEQIPKEYQSFEDGLQVSASSTSRHVSKFEKYRQQALELKDKNIMTAKKVDHEKVRQPSVCVFVKTLYGVEHILFNIKRNQIMLCTREQALDILECEPEEEIDETQVDTVEAAAIKATEAWLAQQSTNTGNVSHERICVVYLVPATKANTSDNPEEKINSFKKMMNG